jgi:uncharacterized OsmC-like protein
MSESMTVRHLDGDRFVIETRGHAITVDQPVSLGGDDSAPTPTELFVASLAGCVAFYARRFLARHQVPADGLAVSATYTLGGRPARVERIAVHLTPPPALPDERREAFLAVASHCTVHNTLREPPEVQILVEDEPARTGAAPVSS